MCFCRDEQLAGTGRVMGSWQVWAARWQTGKKWMVCLAVLHAGRWHAERHSQQQLLWTAPVLWSFLSCCLLLPCQQATLLPFSADPCPLLSCLPPPAPAPHPRRLWQLQSKMAAVGGEGAYVARLDRVASARSGLEQRLQVGQGQASQGVGRPAAAGMCWGSLLEWWRC